MKVVLSMMLGLLALAMIHVAPAAAAPPLAAFARLPAIEQAVISPDGSRVALQGAVGDQRVIFIAPVDGTVAVTVKLGDVSVRDIRWAGDDRLLASVVFLDKGTQYSNGRNFAYHLERNLVIDMKGKVTATLLADAPWSALAISQPILGVIDGDRPTAMILGLDLGATAYGPANDTRLASDEDDLIAALWRVDVASGKGQLAERGNPQTSGWAVDTSGQARVRWDYSKRTDSLEIFARPKGVTSWARIDSPGGEKAGFDVIGYSDLDDAVLLLTEDAGGQHVLRRLLSNGVTTRLGPDKPAPDVGVQWDGARHAPVAILTTTDRPAYQWLDSQLGAVHARLARAFAGRDVRLVSWSRDKSRIVARVDAPDSPPAWFLFDRRTNQASSLGVSYPELAGAAFGKTTWFTYKARDGLDIPAYLTLPSGLPEGARPPLIVMPHGGPVARDEFGFDWWAQALAARGYAVLQPQFRGSAGFGSAFEAAGHGEWGGKMQEDLLDGIAVLASRGVIDRGRVCIVGASYGGYAALFGATVYPSAYRCAVSVNGVADLSLMIGSTDRAFRHDTALMNALRRMMGDPRSDPEALRLASPAQRVTEQTAPILLIHGEHDTTVPFEQSRFMQRRLRDAQKPVDLVVLKGDDHYLSSTASRTKMLESLFAFLDRHLPVTR